MMLEPIKLLAPAVLIQAAADRHRVGMQLQSVPELGKWLKAEKAWWCAPRRMWVMSVGGGRAEALEQRLRRVYQGQHVDFDDVSRMLHAAQSARQYDFFTQMLDVQIFPLEKGDLFRGRWAVSFSYDLPCVEAMRALRGFFHTHAAAWQVQANHPEQILSALENHAGVAAEFVFVHETPVILESLGGTSRQASPIQVPSAPPPESGSAAGEETGTAFISTELERKVDLPVDCLVIAELVSRGVLRDYQVTGIRHLVSQSGACLGDDMGLGKTRQTVVATRMAAGEGRVLILCPATLRINWEREIRAIYPDARVGMLGEDRIATLHACNWVVGNYERLGGLVREAGLEFAVMAVDEAHYLKEHDSGRTRNVFLMGARIPRRYVVTGTPLLSREVEMHTLLRITGHELGNLELKEFRKNYSGTSERRAALAQALQGWMLRRSKSVLKDLGHKHRQERYLSPAEGLGLYKEVYADMSLMAMPKITKLRQALEALKAQFIIETIEGLGEGDKIIVFCEYMATVEALKNALEALRIGCVSLVGADPLKRRQKAVDAFQNDPSVTVFIGTTSAAGVGITLTAANYVVFASLPWTPALMRQAEDRAFRLGQTRDVFVIVPLVVGTIDEGVWQLLANKKTTEEEVVEAVRSALPDQERLGCRSAA